jgi:hypothetical protein
MVGLDVEWAWNRFRRVLMRLVLAFFAIASLSTAVMAQSTQSMACTQARGVVVSQGSAVLHTSSAAYDRYVRDGSFCPLGKVPLPAWVRTADTAQCFVGNLCRDMENDL